MAEDKPLSLIELTAEITANYVSHNRVGGSEVAGLIATVHEVLSELGKTPPAPAEAAKPAGAVTARKSTARPEHILSMIDGKPYKTLKRHIARHGYTPESYREAFGLTASYPMVASAYAAARSATAKAIGLGRKVGVKLVEKAEEAVAPKKRGRKPGALGKVLKAAKTQLEG